MQAQSKDEEESEIYTLIFRNWRSFIKKINRWSKRVKSWH